MDPIFPVTLCRVFCIRLSLSSYRTLLPALHLSSTLLQKPFFFKFKPLIVTQMSGFFDSESCFFFPPMSFVLINELSSKFEEKVFCKDIKIKMTSGKNTRIKKHHYNRDLVHLRMYKKSLNVCFLKENTESLDCNGGAELSRGEGRRFKHDWLRF